VSTRRTRRPDTVTLVKDLISFSLGLALIVHQALFVRPADFNPYLLAVGAALVGVPGVGQLLAPRTDGRRTRGDSPESSPPSRSSSRDAEAEK
jgi:predicted phage tail protein